MMTRSLVTLSLLAATVSLLAATDVEARCCRGNRRGGYYNNAGYATTAAYGGSQVATGSSCQPAAPATMQQTAPTPPTEAAPVPTDNSPAPAPRT